MQKKRNKSQHSAIKKKKLNYLKEGINSAHFDLHDSHKETLMYPNLKNKNKKKERK